LKEVEQARRPATSAEKLALARFAGFGPVALSIFPDPVSGRYKDAGWQALGEELRSLLTPAEYESAKRTTFNAFYTSPIVIATIHEAIARLGVPANATILEPGCGIGNFMGHGQPGARYIGVEMDSISGRIAKAIHPGQDIRIENFRDTNLPEGRIDAVVGNVPFADLKLDYQGQKFSLHDYFFAKSIDALKPGGVMALVTTHFTLDKQNAAIREYLASKADFVGAIRLPSDAFKREGTAVVTDIVFLRKRAPSVLASHIDDAWLSIAPLTVDGAEVSVTGRASRNLIKTIEKQKAARAERLKNLLAEKKKDDGLVFDELGVDHVFVDEAHYFKNLETPTKMERVAGIQIGGSERAFDVYMKARYLGEQHAGHGMTFATGTPISNTMVEMYTMQRFLDPEGLKSRGLEHFDAWAPAPTYRNALSHCITSTPPGSRPRSSNVTGGFSARETKTKR
jgi:hypothetical protein